MCSVPSYQWQSVLAVKYVPQTSIEKHHYLLINILLISHVTKIKINNLFTNPFNYFKISAETEVFWEIRLSSKIVKNLRILRHFFLILVLYHLSTVNFALIFKKKATFYTSHWYDIIFVELFSIIFYIFTVVRRIFSWYDISKIVRNRYFGPQEKAIATAF